MDSRGQQVQFLELPTHFEEFVDGVKAELVGVLSVMWVNQVRAGRRSGVLIDLKPKSSASTAAGAEHAIRFLSAFLNLLLASSAPMRLLKSNSSLETVLAPFLSLAERVGMGASSSLESPSYDTMN